MDEGPSFRGSVIRGSIPHQLILQHIEESRSLSIPSDFDALSCFEKIKIGFYSKYICYFLLFIIDLSWAMIIPSIWLYYHQERGANVYFFGFILASFSIGQFVATPFLGLISLRIPYKVVIFFCILLGILGDILYICGVNRYYILFGRLLSGIAAALSALVKNYINESCYHTERTAILSRIGTLGTVAFLIGPAFSAIFGFLPSTLIYKHQNINIMINSYNAPGYVSAICLILGGFGFLIFFKEKERLTHKTTQLLINQVEYTPAQKQQNNLLLVGLIVIEVFLFNLLVVYETIVTPLTFYTYGWTVKENGLLWLVTSVLSTVSYIILPYLTRRIYESHLLLCNIIVLLFILLFMTPFEGPLALYRFLIGTLFISIFFPISSSLVDSLYSKSLQDHSGLFFGIFSYAQAVARISAPIWAGWVYLYDGVKWVFIILAIGLFFIAFISGASIPKLQNTIKPEPDIEEEENFIDPPLDS